MAGNFRESLETMVDALRANPNVNVFDFEIRPPASSDAIKRAEKALRRPLPDELKEFYAAHDGVFLSWGLKGRKYEDKLKPFGFPDYGAPPGVINLLPISEVFAASWVDDGTINWSDDEYEAIFGASPDEDEEDEDEDERIHAVVFDFYSKFRHADLAFGPKDKPAYALIADDHGAELLESDISSFGTYLDVVLAAFGTERMPFYRVERYPHPQVMTGLKKPRLTLEELLEETARRT